MAARFDKYAHSKQVIKPGKGIIKELVLGVENACRMLMDDGLVGPGNHSAMIPAEQVRRTIARFDASDCDQVHVKITDYGLASTGTCLQVSTSSVGDGVPVRWMPPEAILRRRWSEKSDVWAFAVTVWEMFTHGLVPYTFIF